MMSYKGLRANYCMICGRVATYCSGPGWACDEHKDDTESEVRYDKNTGQPLSA
jgi:hypothetical protein